MKTVKTQRALKWGCLLSAAFVLSCSTEEIDSESQLINASKTSNLVAYTDFEIAEKYAPNFYQDVDTTDGLCSDQSKSGSADWITAVDYDGDWNTKNNWENMVDARSSGKLIPYVYYYTTYTNTHFFVLYSVYHPRDWTDIPFLCSLDTHENDMEAVLITAERNSDGSYGDIINAQTIWHTEVRDYNANEMLYTNNLKPKMFIEAKGHGMRAFEGSSDQDNSYIHYWQNRRTAVQPDADSNNLPQVITYELLALENTLWLQRNNPLTVTGTALVGDNGDGTNRASTPWGWENGVLCKNPAQYLKDRYGWSDFSTNYISDTPIQ